MASPFEKFSDATDGEVTQFKGCLARAGCGRELIRAVNDSEGNELAKVMVEAARQYLNKNPYEMSVDEQIAALRRANEEESGTNPNWEPIPEEDFVRLASNAPVWPKGRHAYRSLRIRFGTGSEGVAKTFEAHVSRIKRVSGGEEGFWRWEDLHSGSFPYKGKPVERLRLLVGNDIHKAVVEWIVTDLDTNRKRESVTAVRGSNSLADELLVVAWLFPDMIRAIDYGELPGLFAAGYEVNVPEYDGESWQRVVLVDFDRDRRQVQVCAHDRSVNNSRCSVPVRWENKR